MSRQRTRHSDPLGDLATYRTAAPNRRWHYVILAAIVLVSIAAFVGRYWVYPHYADANKPQRPVSAPASSQAPAPQTSTLNAAAWQNVEANRLMRDYPQFYNRMPFHNNVPGCRTYPRADKLMPRDLIPNVNVNIVLTYDKNKGEYVAKADRRVKFLVNGRKFTFKGEGGPTTMQKFTWSYRGSVVLFGGFEKSLDNSGAWQWSPEGAEYDAKNHTWTTEVPMNGALLFPQRTFLATDVTTCAAGSVPVPDVKTLWGSLAADGILKPQR